jgi:sec-independent protein translocase protein TatA
MRIGPFGVWEILIILVVVLLIFGPKRLPEMAKGLGQSVRAFRKELRDMKSDLNMDDEPKSTPPAPTRSAAASAPTAEAPTPEPAVEPAPAAAKPRESEDAAS